MGDMIGMSLKTLRLCTVGMVVANLALAVEEGEASKVGNITPAGQSDSRRGEVVERDPVSGIADTLAGTTGSGGGLVPEMPDSLKIENPGSNSSVVYDQEKRTLTYNGDPIVYMKTDNGIEVFSKNAVVNTDLKTVTLTGDLAIFQQNSLSRASRAVYHYDTKILKTTQVQAKIDSMVLRSGEFNYEVDEKGRTYIIGHDASVTTEDDQEPSTWISGREIRIYPEDSISFKGLRTYSEGVPFFYFPFFYHSLNPREGYMPNIGARSYWGGFLLNRYGILFGDRRVEKGRPTADYLATLHLDYRSRRGLGAGVDFEDIELNQKASNMTGLSFYGVDDKDTSISPVDDARPADLDRKRWRVALQNMWSIPIQDTLSSEWRFKANINALSDEFLLRDFYQELYQKDPQPDNSFALTRTDHLTSATLLQRLPINDFYMSDQRTEFSFDRVRAPLFDSSIVYESQTSASFLRQYVPPSMRTDIRRRIDNMSPNDPNRSFWERMLLTNGYFRVHTYHEMSTSYKVGKVLNLTPKIGGGYTGYRDVSGLGSFNQGVFFAAMDSYIKFSRKYDGIHSKMLGLDGVTHVAQPYLTFAYVGANELDPMVPMVDGYNASTNPIALSPGRVTEIDAITTAVVLRYGLKNFLMTERGGATTRWFAWDMFMDAYFHDAADDRDFSNLYSTMTWTPLPWLTYSNIVQFPVLGGDKELRYREYNNYVSFMVTRSLDLIVGHRYLSQHPLLQDSSQMDVQAIYRVTEELALGGSWRWELKSGKMDIQEYNIYKNMGTWYFGMGLYMRKNGNKDELGLGVSFTLKETGAHMPMKFY